MERSAREKVCGCLASLISSLVLSRFRCDSQLGIAESSSATTCYRLQRNAKLRRSSSRAAEYTPQQAAWLRRLRASGRDCPRRDGVVYVARQTTLRRIVARTIIHGAGVGCTVASASRTTFCSSASSWSKSRRLCRSNERRGSLSGVPACDPL